MKHRTRITRHRSSQAWFNVFRRGSALAGLVALGALFGCGAAEGGGEESAHVEARSNAIVAFKESQPDEFKYLHAIAPALSTGTGDPAFCSNVPHSMLVFQRDTSGFIQGWLDNSGVPGTWNKYGGTGSLRKLGGRPACGFLSGPASPNRFILLAKGASAPSGTDKRLFWSMGSWNDDPLTTPPVTVLTTWAAMDGTPYNTNGNPAVGAHDGQLVVVYLNDNGQLAANYWTGGTFSSTLTHPNLPTGWTGIGTPTIAFAQSWANKFVIFVRAKNSLNQFRVYRTFFDATQFTGAVGTGTPVYQSITFPSGAPGIQSDPAYEFFSGDFSSGTLYYRNGTRLYQMSAVNGVDDFRTSVVQPVIPSTTPSISGNPIAIGGVYYEGGAHWIMARGAGNNLYFGESYNDDDLVPN